MNSVYSAYSIYTDEYNNSLNSPAMWADLPGIKPMLMNLWKYSLAFQLPGFLYRTNTFTVGELSSLYHLPDGMFNRSPIIKWMDYKVVA